ncbi:hypothetical protein GA565_24100 [Rouxiella sp. S1S-2]|nr:hypothetical protein GA565_24100 [Rouxiella sp. S1S-2]
MHHYNFTLIATDVEMNSLPKGLDKNMLAEPLKGHVLGATGIVAQYKIN